MVDTKKIFDLLTEVKVGKLSQAEAGELIYILFFAEQQFNMNAIVREFNEGCGFPIDSGDIPQFVEDFLGRLDKNDTNFKY